MKLEDAEVIFIVGCPDGESKRYRVANVREALQRSGVATLAFGEFEVPLLLKAELKAKSLVLFRTPHSEVVGQLIHRVQNGGGVVFFDVDDLVFESDSVDYVRALRHFNARERERYLRGVTKYRETLRACDAVLVPTDFLRERAEAAGKKAVVLPNTLNEAQRALAAALGATPRANGATVRIGYFSGTKTHEVDFLSAEPALLAAMKAHPETKLVLVGPLEISDRWKRLEHRIERHPYMSHLEMLDLLSGVDINLAPLEVGNPYCESKSQLKIFEAALVGVPTIASATRSYQAAIESGVDGFLARSERDWHGALDKLINSAALRKEMGAKAKERALRDFTTEAIAPFAKEVLLETKAPTRQKPAGRGRPARRLKVSWIVPGVPEGSGGHRNIFRVIHFLTQFGHDAEIYVTDSNLPSAELRARVHEHFYPIDCPIHRYAGDIRPTDVVMATHWSTVEPATRHRDMALKLGYFVQDFEPMFYPMGSEYLLAENTYRLGLHPICSGPWIAHVLRTQYGLQADHFIFPIDREIYYPRERRGSGQSILFFGRPEMPRRCFDLGIQMLDRLHQRMPELAISLYGSRSLSNHSFPFPAKVHSLVPTIHDLAQLYSDSDVGVAFSTTNPSLVPYEMMACGLPVVDIGRPGSELNYGGAKDVALLVDPSPDTMARQVEALLGDAHERERRAILGLKLVSSFPTEEQMVRQVEGFLLKLVDQRAETAA